MELLPVFIKAWDIPDAWFQAVFKLLEVGFDYTIEHGSYVGQKRLEYDYITVVIQEPQKRPFEPKLNPTIGIPDPVQPGYIDDYVPYLMTPAKQPNEDYTYGERLCSGWTYKKKVISMYTEVSTFVEKIFWERSGVNQIEHFIELLRNTPNTNQAIMQVGEPTDCLLVDPPCLRHIDMRVKDGKLVFFIYFRSWDLWGGFPANLGAIVLLQEYMAAEIGIDPGPFVCASKGLHLYKYVWELAEVVRGKTMAELRG